MSSTTKPKHSVKVPTQYKVTAKILKAALQKQKSVRTLIFEEKHARTSSLHGVLRNYSNNIGAINNAIEETGILKDNPRLDPELCKVLVTELIFGRKQLTGGGCKPVQTVLEYKERLEKAVSGVEVKKQGQHPRYVRVNTNLLSVADALDYLADSEWRKKLLPSDITYPDFLIAIRALEEDEFLVDIHVDSMLIFHPKQACYWATHDMVRSKKFILQNKATCLVAELLAPPSGATVLDMCAAPGMKTLHICNVMQNKGCIYAVELSKDRYKTLLNTNEEGGCSIVKTFNADALAMNAEQLPNVEYILVDPSCSGSGMQSRMDFGENKKDDKRLNKLAGLQIKILSHAMGAFPDVKRIAYCTCSLWKEENEQVVQRCLQLNPQFKLLSCKKALRNRWVNVGSSDYKGIGNKCLYSQPEHDLTDGIFIALFEKRRDGQGEE
ncbi:probable 28S rRNA (cytosine-C(5))-methyltransferase [Scaptodrosophila lebanonensis]|uniref:Probable 28S rRNA (Cytosine-C(5))-methyltransferase n=1 Tax=Drosophila lebanonensis TaxID=7225 RepID=A0A6J2T2E1_DROLE|nr:probable 28S rRNA (cytosine-C(5))-methyltransferase [Scaptodrosophila lebanonensis]